MPTLRFPDPRALAVALVLGLTQAACSDDAANDGTSSSDDVPSFGTTAPIGDGGASDPDDGAAGDGAADDPDDLDDGDRAGIGPEREAAVERFDAIDAAVARWEDATTLEEARAAAEEARNLVTGPDTLDAGDLDGDGTVAGGAALTGDGAVGFLPGADGSPGLAQAFAGCELVERDVLGGPWDDPDLRWSTLAETIAAWRPDDNTFPTLPSHPQRIIGWASLTLDGASFDQAHEYSGHARLHVDVSRSAIDGCR